MLTGSVLQPWIVPCAWEADSSGCCGNERLVNSDFNLMHALLDPSKLFIVR